MTYITSTTRLSPIFYFNFFTCTGYETKLKECRRPVIYTTTYNGECRNDRYAAAMCEPAGIVVLIIVFMFCTSYEQIAGMEI